LTLFWTFDSACRQNWNAHVFARQKGATDQDVLVLEQGTKNILRISACNMA